MTIAQWFLSILAMLMAFAVGVFAHQQVDGWTAFFVLLVLFSVAGMAVTDRDF